ncbi:MAG: alpha/beta fold hydrolase [Deltaproteobacteria bacterium]|nr:alpha/beta fold hydrolase [Deltaproteobacteria bacterium]
MHHVELRGPANRRLAATWVDAGGAASVVLVHGFTSDRHSRGRFPALAESLAAHGISTLAFDASGCGESDDAPLTVSGLVEDLRAALAFTRARTKGKLGILGHSLGGKVAVLGCPSDVAALVLTGAPLGPMGYDWTAHHAPEQLRALAEQGAFTIERDEPLRKRWIITRELLDSFDDAVDVARVKAPTLLVFGDGDDEERHALALGRAALPKLPDGSRLEVIAGAPHGFGAQYDEVKRLAVDFLAANLG